MLKKYRPTLSHIGSLLMCSTLFVHCASTSKGPSSLGREPSSSLDPATDGDWGPVISLRAPLSAYAQFPKVMMRPDPPADGWWIAPIHASLLTDGDVPINGWARPQEKECPSHMGRQWPASFLVHVSQDQNLPVGASSGQLYIQPIDEHGDKKGGPDPQKDPVDVLYCSGHAPLSDGRILFTGGARYIGLEFGKVGDAGPHDFEDEYGLNYARIFDPKQMSF